jgi:adenylyltransferase/sulfurtransferase
VALSPAEFQRYSRHLLLPEVGVAGQARLRAARVLLVGVGGLGSPAALYLAAAGIGTLGVVDDDRLDLSNLQRQVLYATDDVGEPKAATAKARLEALNPGIAIDAHAVRLSAANARDLIGRYDVVLDGSDRVGTRYLVNDACVLLGRPLVSAAIHRFEGQAMTYVPGRGPCYRCLFPQAAASASESCAEAGVLGVLPGVLGVIQATEAIKFVLGIGELLVGRLLVYDALGMAFREFPVAQRADCAVCGSEPRITDLEDITEACAPEGAVVVSVTAAELAGMIDRGAVTGFGFELIDVREPHEFAAGHIAGARSVPLASLEPALEQFARDARIVFVCRSGARSARACDVARRRGFASVNHLEGGLLTWGGVIDGTMRLG